MWLLDVNLPKKIGGLLGEFELRLTVPRTEGGEVSPTVRWLKQLDKPVFDASSHGTVFSASLPPEH
jgi:hypothetical protein